jgi:glycosyltransferase involved in cell wall biosynthesis
VVEVIQDKAGPSCGVTVSAIVPTRDRPAHALACVKTILANAGLLELLVVDQSEGSETQRALDGLADPRLRYIPTRTRGVGWARNLGIEQSRGEVIAFTDDDCRVAADWITTLAAIFDGEPLVSVVCGRVRVPPELQSRGFAESFQPQQREWMGRYPGFGKDWGITANLAARRNAIAKTGRFDVMLGAGSPLRSGGEPDFLFRVLRSGAKVINAIEVQVDHLGVRAPGKESSRLIRGYGMGTGAALFKHVRLGDTDAMRVYADFIGANVARTVKNLLRGKGPEGLGYLAAFLYGSVASLRYRVDRRQRMFVVRGQGSSRDAAEG